MVKRKKALERHGSMGYYSYHAVARRLIRDGKLQGYYFAENYNDIHPALVLLFDDEKHPVMPIREYRWEKYLPLLPKDKHLSK